LKADTEDENLIALRNDFAKGHSNIETLLPYAEPPHETWAEYFKKEVETLITEKAFRHVGDSRRYVDVVGDVINLVPVRWVSEKIVSASWLPLRSPNIFLGSLDFLSRRSPTGPVLGMNKMSTRCSRIQLG
jgi:hypothetical protein